MQRGNAGRRRAAIIPREIAETQALSPITRQYYYTANGLKGVAAAFALRELEKENKGMFGNVCHSDQLWPALERGEFHLGKSDKGTVSGGGQVFKYPELS